MDLGKLLTWMRAITAFCGILPFIACASLSAQATWNRHHYSQFHYLDFNYHPTEALLSEHQLDPKFQYPSDRFSLPVFDSTAHFPMACNDEGEMLLFGTDGNGMVHNRFGKPLKGLRNGIWADYIDANFTRKTGFDEFGWGVDNQFYASGTVSFPMPGKPGIMGVLGLTGNAGHRFYSYKMPWAYEPQPTEGMLLFAELDMRADSGRGKVHLPARSLFGLGFCKFIVTKTADESGYFVYAVNWLKDSLLSIRFDSSGYRQVDAVKLPDGWLELYDYLRITPDGSWLSFNYDIDTYVPDESLRRFEMLFYRLDAQTGKILGLKKLAGNGRNNVTGGVFTGDSRFCLFSIDSFIGGRLRSVAAKLSLSELETHGEYVHLRKLKTLEHYPNATYPLIFYGMIGRDGACYIHYYNRNDSLLNTLLQLKNPSDPIADWVFNLVKAPVPPGQYTDEYRSYHTRQFYWWKTVYPRNLKRIAMSRPLKKYCSNLPIEFAFQNGYCADSIRWHFGDGNQLLTYTNEVKHIYRDSGVFTVMAYFFRRDLRDTLEIQIKVYPFQKPDLGRDTLLCTGQLLSVSGLTRDAISYRWEHGENSSAITIDSAGYWVLWAETEHCLGSDTLVTGITDCTIQLNQPCENDTVLLKFPYSALQADSMHVECGLTRFTSLPDTAWRFLFPPGNYHTFVTRYKNALTRRDSVVVTVHPLPDFNLGNDTLLCKEESLLLRVPGGLQRPVWSTGDSGQTLLIAQAGKYALVASNGKCRNADTLQVWFVDCTARLRGACTGSRSHWVFDAGADSMLWEARPDTFYTFRQLPDSVGLLFNTEGRYTGKGRWFLNGLQTSKSFKADVFTVHKPFLQDSVRLCKNAWLDIHQHTSNARYAWNDGGTGRSRRITQESKLIIEVRKGDCIVRDSVKVQIENCDCPLYLPNALYLQSDFANDLLKPQFGCELPPYRLKVFNRWGQQLFEGDRPWDGVFNGRDVPEGLYIWQLQFRDPLSELPRNERGTVLVLR